MHPVYDKTFGRKRCRELWLDLLEQYQASGLSKKDFAKNNDIKLDDLSRWYFRYKKKKDKPKFSAIKIITPAIQNTGPIKLRVSDRYCLELSSDFDAGKLARILTVIETRVC
ncbi:MAG: hypothetical protein WC748_05115 [Legionellales bacterium]|jgi:hypothetical protein